MFYDYNLRVGNFLDDYNDYVKYAKKLEIKKTEQLLWRLI